LPDVFAERVRVDVPEPPGTLFWLNKPVSPVAGKIDTDKLTVPVNPFTGAMVIVEAPVRPTSIGILVALVATVKSWTWYVTITEAGVGETLELVPVTFAW
jgi:hypothetical protein